jgi:opacity protein-like surface antigen
MNKKAVALICCLFLLLLSSAVQAREGAYLAGHVGASLLSDSNVSIAGVPTGTASYKTGLNGAAAFGYSYVPGRVEVELNYNTNEIDGTSDSFDSLALMFNAYAEFFDQDVGFTTISTYIGGGLGVSQLTLDAATTDNSEFVFAWQLAFGIGWELSESLILDLGYRHFTTADPAFDSGVLELDYASNIIYLGLRFDL